MRRGSFMMRINSARESGVVLLEQDMLGAIEDAVRVWRAFSCVTKGMDAIEMPAFGKLRGRAKWITFYSRLMHLHSKSSHSKTTKKKKSTFLYILQYAPPQLTYNSIIPLHGYHQPSNRSSSPKKNQEKLNLQRLNTRRLLCCFSALIQRERRDPRASVLKALQVLHLGADPG